jgi:ATP-dependent Clp protease ATP-binding subunit ClpC
MFERYTEKARRVIFFARYEASQFGSFYIETEHLLLGILREDKTFTNRFLRSHASVASIRQQIEAHTTIREKVSTSVDLPLSNEAKRVLAYAAEEAERLGHKHIGTEHLFLGLLREEDSFAAQLLKERSIQIDSIRKELTHLTVEAPPLVTTAASSTSSYFKDLTQASQDGSLDTIVARDQEVAAVIEILCSRRKNPLIVGRHGAGKTAVVHALTQRIANGEVPPRISQKRVIEVDPAFLATWLDRRRFDELQNLIASMATPDRTILSINCEQRLAESQTHIGWHDFTAFLKWLHSHRHFQCIAVADEQEFAEALPTNPWLLEIFREVHVRPLDDETLLTVLRARRASLEAFHGVTYLDGALETAFQSAAADPSRGSLLQTALDLLDAAATLVTLRETSPEIAEVQKRIGYIAVRLENAVQNHEFEKARFYSDEEKKERENLRVLLEKYSPNSPLIAGVTSEDVKNILTRWSKYPYAP